MLPGPKLKGMNALTMADSECPYVTEGRQAINAVLQHNKKIPDKEHCM
jgi:hypothetical protein